MKALALVLVGLLTFSCASGEMGDPNLQQDPALTQKPEQSRHSKSLSNPEPLECIAIETTPIKDCTLYTLKCEDGSDQLALICPPQYWDWAPPIPDPIKPQENGLPPTRDSSSTTPSSSR